MGIDNVNDLEPRVQYVATAGQTEFDYPFPIFSANGLQIAVNGELVVSGFTVDGVAEDAGGTVTFDTGLDEDDVVTIWRETVQERLTDFQQNGAWVADNFNDEFDRYLLMIQEMKEKFSRVLMSPITAETPIFNELTFDPIGPWLGKYLFINQQGVLVPADGSAVAQVLTTDGDLLTRSGGELARIPVGSSNQVLKVVAGAPGWVDGGSNGGSGLSRPIAAAHFVGAPGSSGGESADVQIFLADGTWTKPADAKTVKVYAVGGGGGGGAGQTGTTGNNRGGGGGGAGAGTNEMEFLAADLAATVAVTVGAAGTGGAGSTSSGSTGGASGTAGGASSFGAHLNARGGGLGDGQAGGGTAGGGTGGKSLYAGLDGGNGSAGVAGSPGASPTSEDYRKRCGGAGGGGGINTSDTRFDGGASSTYNISGNFYGTAGSGTYSVAGGVGNGDNGDPGVALGGQLGVGGGGGGGAAGDTASNGGNGGVGGFPGGGGGGGGAVSTDGGSRTSGAGGAGGAGVVIVITYF